jgi:Fe-S cluster biogenesis protein NfuA
MNSTSDLQALSAAIEEQADLIEKCADPATRAAALELLRAVMDLHKSALERMLAIIKEKDGEAGSVVESLALDPLVRSVLVLHDLHPHAMETRIAFALEQFRPKLKRYSAEAKVVSVADGVVRIALDAPSHCGSTSDTLKSALEQVLMDAAPDAEIVVETAAQPNAKFISIDALRSTAKTENAEQPSEPIAQATGANHK